MKKNKKKNNLVGVLSYNETALFNYMIHLGFGVGILRALPLLYIRYFG
jgi:hypothetical protein